MIARAALLLFVACNSWAITLSTLRSDCRILVKDTGSSRQRFSDAQLLRFLNEGQKEVVRYSKPIRKSYQFELVANTTYYSLPTDFLTMTRVSRSYYVLQEMSVAALDKNNQWETSRGLPINYFINFSSRTKIGFYPYPTSTSTGTIRIEYIATAADLSADSDQPYNSIQELQIYGYPLAFYCAYRASLLDSQTAQAQAYFAEWRSALDMTADSTNRPGYKPNLTPASTPGGGTWSPTP